MSIEVCGTRWPYWFKAAILDHIIMQNALHVAPGTTILIVENNETAFIFEHVNTEKQFT